MKGLFITATGTGCGKTWLARGMARSRARAGRRVAALKPVETGVVEQPGDAIALARAAGRAELINYPGFRRMREALSPRAAELAGDRGLDVDEVARVVREAMNGADVAVVEGAGGLYTPLCRAKTVADLALKVDLDVLVVALDALGTLSHTIALVRAARTTQLRVAGIALVAPEVSDGTERENARILAEELEMSVWRVPRCADTDDSIADVLEMTGILSLLQLKDA